jgi:hypothetical protein
MNSFGKALALAFSPEKRLYKKLRCNSTVKIRFGRKKILNYAYVLKNGVGRYNIFFFIFTQSLLNPHFLSFSSRQSMENRLTWRNLEAYRLSELIIFFNIKSCQYSMFYTNCSWIFIESVNVFVLPRFDLCHVLSSSTRNFAHAQTLSRMSSLSGCMNIARVNNFPFIGPLCRVWVCFYWFHHVFPILSVILTKYHYIILTDYPGM